MAASGPTPKLMLFLDLDDTHFNSYHPGIAWVGQEKDWLALYHELIQLAQAKGVELLFSVITKKQNFDDIAEQAAVSFKDLLSIGNPGMYFEDKEGLRWCLVKYNERMVYECINYQPVGDEDPPFYICESSEQPSHFAIASLTNKSDYMLEIAKYHGIAPECCLLLDDTPDVILNAVLNNINTVSFEEFCPHIRNEKEKAALYKRLQDPYFVEPILQVKRQEVKEKVKKMIDAVLAKTKAVGSSPSEATPNIHHPDPRKNSTTILKTLFAWDSFHSVLGCITTPAQLSATDDQVYTTTPKCD